MISRSQHHASANSTRRATVAAGVFAALALLVVAFQIALAAGAPWGRLTMSGAYPGQLPPAMRAAALVQASALVFFGVIVAVRARLVLHRWHRASRYLVWLVIAYSVVGTVLNTMTRSTLTRTAACMIALLLAGCGRSPTAPLYDGYTLHGAVLDARNDSRLGDVRVLVGREGSSEMHPYALTDEAGEFEFRPSPSTAPSTELFRCERAGYVPLEVLARTSTRLREFEYRLEIRLEPAAAP
jgi:hypothetical protein